MWWTWKGWVRKARWGEKGEGEARNRNISKLRNLYYSAHAFGVQKICGQDLTFSLRRRKTKCGSRGSCEHVKAKYTSTSSCVEHLLLKGQRVKFYLYWISSFSDARITSVRYAFSRVDEIQYHTRCRIDHIGSYSYRHKFTKGTLPSRYHMIFRRKISKWRRNRNFSVCMKSISTSTNVWCWLM